MVVENFIHISSTEGLGVTVDHNVTIDDGIAEDDGMVKNHITKTTFACGSSIEKKP